MNHKRVNAQNDGIRIFENCSFSWETHQQCLRILLSESFQVFRFTIYIFLFTICIRLQIHPMVSLNLIKNCYQTALDFPLEINQKTTGCTGLYKITAFKLSFASVFYRML
jgi:hypothetical protein